MNHPVVVIGGGISGLVAAYRLDRAGIDVTLIEAGDRLGGKILTTEFAGGRVDMGPDSFLARDPILLDICDELGIADELVAPTGFGAQVWLEQGLRRLPVSTYFGIPLHVAGARRTGILEPLGAARARVGTWMPQPKRTSDIAVGSLVRRRFGRQVLDRMVDPVLAGTRAGDPSEISAQAALPEAWSAISRGRRLTRSLRGGRSRAMHGPPPFYGFRGGMRRLVDALAGALPRFGARTHCSASSVRHEGDRFVVQTDVGEMDAAGVIVTTPPQVTAGLVSELSDEAAEALRELDAVDIAIAAFAYDGHPELPEGSGMLVPSSRRKLLTGATWYSRKWPDAAPADATIVRCFAGRASGDRLPEDHDDLLEELHAELSQAIGGLGAPIARQGIRWSNGLPIYRVGHLGRVERIRRALAAHPQVRVAGAAYGGSGLPDCARQASEAAAALVGELRPEAR